MNGMTPQERAILDAMNGELQAAKTAPLSDSALRGALDELSEELGSDAVSIPTGIIVMWSGSSATIPSGWGLCDGSGNATGSGIDLRGRFIVCVGSDGDADHQTYAYQDVGGYQYHGGTLDANNHDDHDLVHYHNTNPLSAPTQCADGAGDDTIYAWSSDPSGGTGYCWGVTGTTTWSGSGSKPDAGSVISHSQTDNRPPFYALCFIEKLP